MKYLFFTVGCILLMTCMIFAGLDLRDVCTLAQIPLVFVLLMGRGKKDEL